MIKFIKKRNGGYALIEMLFYISIFVILSVTIINALVMMVKSFAETSIQADFVQSGNILERMSREIRQATSIDTTSTSSNLKLNSTTTAGAAKTIQFVLSGTNLQLWEGNVLTGNLNAPNIQVTSLIFTQITTAKGKAIRVQISVQNTKDKSARTVNFYDTIGLRRSY